jgi:hypothetical protein
MIKRKVTPEDIANAKEMLLKMVAKGDSVYTNVVHVSKNGMSRDIKVYVVCGKHICNITLLTSDLTGLQYDYKKSAIKMKGAGMDMGLEIVQRLSYSLFGSSDKLYRERL